MENKHVLLIRPNSTNDKQDRYVTFPLGIGYIAAVLKQNNYDVKILDLTLCDVDYQDVVQKIAAFNPYVIGISAMSYQYAQIKKLGHLLKDNFDCKLILGGHLASHNYEMILNKTNIDICVIGEGELTAIDLLTNIHNLSVVKGIAYKENNNVILNESRKLIQDIDSIPFPAYELFDMEKYYSMSMNDIYMPRKFLYQRKEHRKISMEIGRGCPFSCNFCSKMFKNIRRRSIDRIFEEMKYLIDKYNITIFGFQDELLFVNQKFIVDFCTKIKPLGINWYGNARIDTVNKDMIELVSKNGCLVISYGVESGSQKILLNMNKKTKTEQIKNILKMTLDVGMPISMGLILGYPGEDDQTIQDTINLLKEVGHPGLSFRYITPYPGSLLYNQCLSNGTIKDEEAYLNSVGDGTGPYRFRINFTDFSDQQLIELAPNTIKKALKNYFIYLLKHPIFLLKYLRYKDFMNPVYFLYNRWKNPTGYDKAAKRGGKK